MRGLVRARLGFVNTVEYKGAFTWYGFAINPMEGQISHCKRIKREIK